MASNSLSSRIEELRSRNPQSPSERAYSGYSTPTRYSGNFSTMHSHSQSTSSSTDPRSSSLQRRFTADSNSFPTSLTPLSYQSMDAPAELNTYHKAQALDKKRIELERLREQKKRMEDEFKRLDSMQQEQESEVARLSKDLHTLSFSPGHQSEPTTPPEFRDQGYYSSGIFGNKNRYSSASLTTPSGLNRMSRSGSQVTSPPNELAYPAGENDKFPSHSNRYSMPVSLSTKHKQDSMADFPSMGLAQIDTTSILFGDDDDKHDVVTSPAVKNYLQAHTTEDKFPVLLRSNHKPGTLSASSAALDLANLQSASLEAKTENKSNGWPAFSRQHQSQHSLSQNNDATKFNRASLHSPSSSQQSVETVVEAPDPFNSNRHSMEATLASLASSNNHARNGSNGILASRPMLSNVHSHSTNDIPTFKGVSMTSNANTTSPLAAGKENVFNKNRISLSRMPGNIITNRLSRDLTTGEALADEPPATAKFPPLNTELQASAAPFGPSMNATTSPIDRSMGGPVSQQNLGIQDFLPYGVAMLNMGMNPMQMATNFQNGVPYFSPQQHHQQHFSGFGQYNPGGRFPDSQQKVIQQRRAQNVAEGNRRNSRRGSHAHSDPDTARFANTKIESYIGEIYALCKDQHGCRYLQKQLEARHPETVQIIFAETSPHVVELMTDPFGNYLCQKLLEHTNDTQRTTLVENAAPHMVQIALNQHGTRALQKMIEHLSTQEQIAVVRNALKDNVVELIQDLNGNHVVQKCLNRLTAEDSQFIFDAVGGNCVVVGTHRHGCCVLQRCIDHASGMQKSNLIAQITSNAFRLIQDPYGNYVLQYIVDLNDPNFTEPLCHVLRSRVVEFSRHKFSSNVIEKCIRHAAPPVATLMIEEMLGAAEIERMLRDSFANYVVQTALDCAEPATRVRLVDAIRPILPSIRSTPHGRRIQSKIVQSENSSHATSPIMSPIPSNASLRGNAPMSRNGSVSHQNSFYSPPPQPGHVVNGFGNQPGFVPAGGPVNGQRMGSNGNYPAFSPMTAQNSMHQPMPQGFGRAPQATGYNFF